MTSPDTDISKTDGAAVAGSPFRGLLLKFPQQVQKYLKIDINPFKKDHMIVDSSGVDSSKKDASNNALKMSLEKKMQAWKENPSWTDSSPEIKVSVPKGSLSKLNAKVNIGLPPDAIYNIVTDPDNRRVFKNIKEVISRKVLLDEGSRQVVELEQAAIWRFLWWSGTISVHVLVDHNREDHSMNFRQIKTGFMKRFEGCWRVEPIMVDEQSCLPFRPKTLEEYDLCTNGKGRIASKVSLDQLIEPSIVPPPPISWYLRGITTRTTEMIINDLLAEAARIRGFSGAGDSEDLAGISSRELSDLEGDNASSDIKERWAVRRRNAKSCRRRC